MRPSENCSDEDRLELPIWGLQVSVWVTASYSSFVVKKDPEIARGGAEVAEKKVFLIKK